MSSTIPHTLLPTFSLCEAPVLLWLSVVRDQTNNAIRVMEGNTDTREKDISKMYFYLDAICSKAPGPRSTWEMECLGHWEFCPTPESENRHYSLRERLKNKHTNKTAAISHWSGKISCVVMMVKAKSTFSDIATVYAKLSWAELNSPGKAGWRPDFTGFNFPLLKRLLLIIFWIEPPRGEASGSSYPTRPRPGGDIMPLDNWVGVNCMMRQTRLSDMIEIF